MPEEDRKKPRRRRTKTAPLTIVSASSSAPVSGVVIDPATQRRAFYLRSNAIPVDEIAEVLGLTESEVARAIYEYAEKLNRSEVNATEVARRLQIEQLDMALRQLMPHITGVTLEGGEHPVNLDRLDQFLKIMDQKAKLTGINAPQRVDLTVRLRQIADSGEFEYEDLEEILKDVVRDFPQLGPGSGV